MLDNQWFRKERPLLSLLGLGGGAGGNLTQGGSASAEVNDYIQNQKKKLAFEVPDEEAFKKAVQASEKYQSQRDKTRYSNTDLR